MIIRAVLCATVSLAMSQAVVVYAQQADATSPVAQKGSLYLDVVVAPKSGGPVGDLAQADFTLLDNGVPQTLRSFRLLTGRQAPLSLILVLDAVNASFRDLAIQRVEVEKFLQAEGGHLAYPTGVVLLTERGPQIVAGFSTDGNALGATLEATNSPLRAITRAAALDGAAERWQVSVKSLRQLVAGVSGHSGYTAMVWISPGWMVQDLRNDRPDPGQQHMFFSNLVGLSNAMFDSRISLYSLDPRGAGESGLRAEAYQDYLKAVTSVDRMTMGHLALPVLAIQSGGEAFYSTNDLSVRLQEIVDHATPFYEISYDSAPGAHSDECHHLEVKIAKPGLIARSHQVYYANPSAKN